ncbi:protein-(glutamine-N5) methyltransferase, release factor-specific [Cellulosimicrobium sp. TH-20]|uniref:peptide chain release factor N(5)-glutamine methyltransferase n=1 Tax=Cellulosimicrobium sp. TH-20 TaxID=1980001 RepID=UPI000A17EA78|nr:peptide chain release factor N(5)-glutamine methyltransferase [Cellulosimicrobium sp. TH-20]ARK04883.1 protein-(glutamine-N5) methyltransferase, release factor-specific [Cellulosimicrobium sp. TH-20]
MGDARTERSVPAALTADDLRRAVRAAEGLLVEAGVPSARHDAEALAAWSLGLPRLEWYRLPAGDAPLAPALPTGATDRFLADYADAVERRRGREPLQRIVGHTVFRHVTVEVLDDVFVPRPETETVAQVAIDEAARLRGDPERTDRPPLVVDLCCGSGVIGISVDVEVPGSRVVAVDLSPDAVRATTANAGRVGSGTQRTLVGDVGDPALLAELDGTVDVVVSNPPYIPPDAVPVDPEVRDHDPDLALYGRGADGLEVPRAVVRAAARLLRPGGLFVMEHAEVQAADVRAAARAAGAFVEVRTLTDLTGRDRMVVARRAGAVGAADDPGSPHGRGRMDP